MLWYFNEANRNAMKLENINVTETIEKAREMLKDTKNVPAELAPVFSVLLTILEILLAKLGTNSKNSSTAPSQDPFREKTPRDKTNRKPGGQLGRVGKNLRPFENPDEIIEVSVDQTKLPSGHVYKKVGFLARQVVEIHLFRHIKEYRLEIVENEKGKRFTAEGPMDISRPIQYGASIKAMAVYLSIYQLIPYNRVEEYFRDQVQIPVSAGSLYNFNEEAGLVHGLGHR